MLDNNQQPVQDMTVLHNFIAQSVYLSRLQQLRSDLD